MFFCNYDNLCPYLLCGSLWWLFNSLWPIWTPMSSVLKKANKLNLSLSHCGLVCHMVAYIWVNIGSCNGLLPEGTKPLPEPMFTFHQLSAVTPVWGQFHKRYSSHQSLWLGYELLSKFQCHMCWDSSNCTCHFSLEIYMFLACNATSRCAWFLKKLAGKVLEFYLWILLLTLVRERYGVSFVDPTSDWYSAWIPAIIYAISYHIEPCYNGSWL